jgi:GntR family transcriptional regulator
MTRRRAKRADPGVDTSGEPRHDHVIMMNLLTRPRRGVRDLRSAEPLYVQLREALRAEIEERGLRPGDRLPTEAELEERYGVSRSTIRQAVGDLQAEGLVERVQGKGTFVTAAKIQHVPLLTSFTELLRSQGYEPTHRALDVAEVVAPPTVCQELGIDEGTRCRYLERLFLADGEPVGLSKTWLPLPVLGAHDTSIVRGVLEGRSLYELLAECSPELVPRQGVETIQPMLAGEPESRLLGCDVGTALLQIRRRTRTRAGLPLEWTHLAFVPGRYEYRVELHGSEAAGEGHV